MLDPGRNRRHSRSNNNSLQDPSRNVTDSYSVPYLRWHRARRRKRETSTILTSSYTWTSAFRLRALDPIHVLPVHNDASSTTVVQAPYTLIPAHADLENGTCAEASRMRSTHICASWSSLFLHIHDGCRRRRKKTSGQEVSGYLCAYAQSELYPLAGCADHQLPVDAFAISDTVRQHYWYCLDSVLEFDE